MAIDLSTQKVIAVIGAGGKTTLCRALTSFLPGKRIYVTTTHMHRPEEDFPCLENPTDAALNQALMQYDAVSVSGPPVDTGGTKVGAPEERVYRACCEQSDHVVIEADGAKMRLLKLHGENEPVIPENTGLVLCSASLRALGKPLIDAVHRSERICEVLKKDPREPVAEADIALLLALPKTDQIPYVPILNQTEDMEKAKRIQLLLRERYGLCSIVLPAVDSLCGGGNRLGHEGLRRIFTGLENGFKDWK